MNAAKDLPLPPGQRARTEFPQFGVSEFARRPLRSTNGRLEFAGVTDGLVSLGIDELTALPRVTLTADFHCAAGWTYRSATWSGYRFRDVWRALVRNDQPSDERGLIVIRCQDGYRTSLPLEDLLAPEVLIADRLNDAPLSNAHGGPLRLVAPAHYGYKSAKHLARIELRADARGYRPLLPRLLDHPRARVALEERGQFLPGWLLRYLFRPLIEPTIRKLQTLQRPRE